MTNYLINLESDTERLVFQEAQFRSLGMSFERVRACTDDPRRLDRFRWWCGVLRDPVRGEIGCALSHLEVYRRMVERDEPCAAVFEDDAVLSPSLPQALARAEATCRENPHAVVLLGDHRRTKDGEPLAGAGADVRIGKVRDGLCSEGYVIGCAAAARLLRARQAIGTPADYWRHFERHGWIRLFGAEPPVCGQDQVRFGTRLGEKFVVSDWPFGRWLWWKIRRLVGWGIDRFESLR